MRKSSDAARALWGIVTSTVFYKSLHRSRDAGFWDDADHDVYGEDAQMMEGMTCRPFLKEK